MRNQVYFFHKDRKESMCVPHQLEKFCACVAERMKPVTRMGPIRDTQGMSILSDSYKAEAFNNFFIVFLLSMIIFCLNSLGALPSI